MSMLFHGDSRSRNGENVSAVAGFALFAAPAFGPVVGGAIIGVGGWRWIFLINLPIGVISLLLHRAIPRDFGRPADSKTSFDVPGFVALAAAMCAVLEAAQSGPRHGWMAKEAVIPMVLGVMLFIVYQRLKSPHHPAVDTSLIQRANTRLAVLLSAVASVATFAALVLIPTYAQEYQRYSPSATGWAMLPAGIITGLGSVLSRRIQGSIGMRATVAVGFVILSVATLTLTSVTRDTSLLTLAAILSGRAAAIGLITTPLLGLISSSVQADASADATTLFNIVQRVAASLGIAAIGTWYAHRAAAAGPQVALHECGIALSVLSGLALLATAFLHAAPVGSHEGDIQETKG